jgi:hypothetical protein
LHVCSVPAFVYPASQVSVHLLPEGTPVVRQSAYVPWDTTGGGDVQALGLRVGIGPV